MNAGKTLFAQVMEFVPWKTFGRIVERYRGDAGVRTLGCAEVFRIMAFAQLTWRESLRDIETCMAANQGKLFHMGLRSPPARSTLADALNLRDWRIYRALAERLIAHARALYAHDATVLDLDAAVYALDSTTIDLCLSLFGWAPFRSAKAAIKLHTLLDLRSAIPAFLHVSDGKLHEVKVFDAGGRKLLCHGPRLRRLPALVRDPSGWRFLRHPRHAADGCAPRLLARRGPASGRHRADRHRQKRTPTGRLALHLSTDPVGLHLRENPDKMRPSEQSTQLRSVSQPQPTDSI
jgi:hypothetical protein